MTLSEADFEQFIEAMHTDPVLRDRVRNAILADDFLALPGLVAQLVEHSAQVDRRLAELTGRMDQLTERMDQLAQRMDELAQRMDRLTERMDQLAQRMDELAQRMDQLADRMAQLAARVDTVVTQLAQLTGRVGNIEGMMYEDRYVKHLASRLGRSFRRVRWIDPANIPELVDAVDSGRITDAEWDDVLRIDAVAWAVRKGDVSGGDVLVAIEISRVVDDTDVERAHRRAGILHTAGLPARACVDGDSIREDSLSLANMLLVESLVRTAA